MKCKNLSEFYTLFQLSDYPFNIYTAENEIKYASKLFVHPYEYDLIKSSFDEGRSMIVRGNRGAGKTTLIQDLYQNAKKPNVLQCFIDDYSSLPLEPKNADFYELIIHSLVEDLFDSLVDKPERISRLKKEEKIFLSCLLQAYTSQITRNTLLDKIEKIQLGPFKRFFKNYLFGIVRFVLNYGLTSIVNLFNDTIRVHFGMLPPVDNRDIIEILPQINFNVDTDFNTSTVSYSILIKICNLINKLGFDKIIVFFDKFDEDNRMENNAETIATFFEQLLIDNKLLECSSIQVVISVWEVPFRRIKDKVRTQKHYCPLLSWPKEKLEHALNKRLSVFSNEKITDYHSIIDSSVEKPLIDKIFILCNENPRDLWHILNQIFRAQCSINPSSDKITARAIARGLESYE